MPRHHTVVIDSPATTPVGDAQESTIVTCPFPFDELLVSWNVARPQDGAFTVEIAVKEDTGVFSPWLEVGVAGRVPGDRRRSIEYARGRIDVDWFRATGGSRFLAARARLRGADADCRLDRIAFCFTDRAGTTLASPRADFRPIDLKVPIASQQAAPESLRSRICSPTALSMVLAYRGVALDPETLAARVHDAEHDVYGNWPRSIQVAYEAGCPGFLTRFANWDEVNRAFSAGQPLIASIGVEPGQLTGAPYERTTGHLVVLRGFDERGDVRVNDPAAPESSVGRVYARRELETVWMRRGGTAYVIEARRGEEFRR